MTDRAVIFVESRMASTRLPGKNMAEVNGRPMVAQLLRRLLRAREAAAVCLCTTTNPEDAALQAVAREVGAACFRGSEEDVLDRVLSAARDQKADIVVEITGDCPLADPELIDQCLATFRDLERQGAVHYAANLLNGYTWPIGLDVQIYRTELLAEVDRLTQDFDDRNNVTPYIYGNGDTYRLVNLAAPESLCRPRFRLCVDYAEDLEVIRAVYAALGDFCRYPEILRFLDTNPDVVAGNTTGLAARLGNGFDPFPVTAATGPVAQHRVDPWPERR